MVFATQVKPPCRHQSEYFKKNIKQIKKYGKSDL